MLNKVNGIRRKNNLNVSKSGSIYQLTPEEKTARAKKNWDKLRTHINQMRERANYFVIFLDEVREQQQEQ